MSRPREHGDNPILYPAMKKIRRGMRLAELSEEEAAADREYGRALRGANLERARSRERKGYRRRVSAPLGGAGAREKLQRDWMRMTGRPGNGRMREARDERGLSQEEEAAVERVARAAVGKWERYGVVPRCAEVRRRVSGLLGDGVWGDRALHLGV